MKIFICAIAAATLFAAHPGATRTAPFTGYATTPPAAWADLDPADSLYRAARRALNDKDYETAARLFDDIVTSYPKSEYTPDALYWKGLALYRGGELDLSRRALEVQAERFPNAATRGDAKTLLVLVKGQLAKRGDAAAKEDIARAAAGDGSSSGSGSSSGIGSSSSRASSGRAGSSATANSADCGDLETQIAALDALQQMDAERVLPLLKKVMARRDDCSIPLRKNALFILAQKQGTDRENVLLSVAKSDPNSAVRADAVFHLSQGNSDASLSALEDLLLHNDDKTVRSNALFALAQRKSDRARNTIKAFVLSDDASVALRKDAIFQLATGRDVDLTWLISAYGKLPNVELRKDLMFQLATRPGPETSKWLVAVASDPKENIELRKDAVFHLASRKGESSDELTSIFDRLPTQLKKDVLFHIAQRHDGASLDKLIAIAKSDPDPQMRKDALFYVAQSKDPKALKALEEIVAP